MLRYYADLSETQIAATMGITRGSVKVHAARAKDALRAALANSGLFIWPHCQTLSSWERLRVGITHTDTMRDSCTQADLERSGHVTSS